MTATRLNPDISSLFYVGSVVKTGVTSTPFTMKPTIPTGYRFLCWLDGYWDGIEAAQRPYPSNVSDAKSNFWGVLPTQSTKIARWYYLCIKSTA